jgi:integrase
MGRKNDLPSPRLPVAILLYRLINICTYLTGLYNVEHDPRFVQDHAGHASPTTTAIYAKTNSKARKRQVEALDNDDMRGVY